MITVRITYDPYHMSTSMNIGGIDVRRAIGTYDKIKNMMIKENSLQSLLEINEFCGWKGLLLEIIGYTNEEKIHFVFRGREQDFLALKETMESQKQYSNNKLFDIDVTYEIHLMSDDEIVAEWEKEADAAIESNCQECVVGDQNTDQINSGDDVKDNTEVNAEKANPSSQLEKEIVYISTLTQIRSGDSLKFVDKNVYIQANIDCYGELMFLDCNVFYNCGEAIGKITLSPGAELNVWDSHVLGGVYDDTAFIRGKQAEINCTNSIFKNCNNFIDAETTEIYMDKCGVYNCISKFICTKVDYMSVVGQSQITNTLIVVDDPQALELAKEHEYSIAYIFDIQRCEYKNNLFYYPAISSDAPWIIPFTGISQQVEECTFIMLGEQRVSCAYNSKLVRNCLFVGGSGVVSLNGNSNLSSSMFIGCKNAVMCGKDTLKECTFVDCLDTTIEAKFWGSAVIENCTFMNTKVVAKKQKGKYENEIGPCIKLYCDREFMEKGTNQPNKVTGCTFYHLNNYDYIIAPAAGGKPEETIAVIEDCHFANCDCAETIKMDVHYYSAVLRIKKTVRDVMKVINSKGVDPYSWRSGSEKTISKDEVNVDITEMSYGCEYLTSVSFIKNGLTTADKLLPLMVDFEQKVILGVE